MVKLLEVTRGELHSGRALQFQTETLPETFLLWQTPEGDPATVLSDIPFGLDSRSKPQYDFGGGGGVLANLTMW